MISAGGRIRKLSPHLVNQIAAGEVIERPASVVKELLENAIDAGATDIRIDLEEGGKRLIRITDDGMGIAPVDLPLAVASHATSKLRSEADLHRIHTLGFRGEALASIASVSELDIVSRPAGQEAGERVVARDGTVAEGAPEPMAPGTRVTVKNLFYNVPARRRFLKGDRAEVARIHTIVKELALAMPTVGFTVVHDGRTSIRYPSDQPHTRRIAEVLGEDLAGRLIPLPPHGQLMGWIAPPDIHRRTGDGIHGFLNGRAIRDKVVLHAVREGYRGYQIPGHHPVAVVFLDLPPESVDVNVHPTKQEVRFQDSAAVHALVRRAVRDALTAAGSAPSLGSELEESPATMPAPRPTSFEAGSAPPAGDHGAAADRAVDAAGFAVAEGETSPGGRETSSAGSAESRPPAEPREPSLALGGGETRAPVVPPAAVEGREVRAFQVRSSFLVVEEEEGLLVIDQHALHEKILYEEILAAREAGVRSQPLLVPQTVRLDPSEWEAFAEVRESLAELGLEADEFGDAVVIVRAVPAGFENRAVDRLLREVLGKVVEARRGGSDTLPDLRERLLQTMACKRAVKAGQPLSPEMVVDLIRGRARAFQPQNCPHGRPSELRIGWEELARRFDRK